MAASGCRNFGNGKAAAIAGVAALRTANRLPERDRLVLAEAPEFELLDDFGGCLHASPALRTKSAQQALRQQAT